MITFASHQARAGMAGASEDFEQMLGLLVRATSGEASLVFANPGDWGIDVLVGDLRGRVTVWQAKYFPSLAAFFPAAYEYIGGAPRWSAECWPGRVRVDNVLPAHGGGRAARAGLRQARGTGPGDCRPGGSKAEIFGESFFSPASRP
jgi:hypothetical protein